MGQQVIAWKRGDTTPLRATLERYGNGAWTPQGLAGATVRVLIREDDSGALAVAGPCVVANAPAGEVTYDWAAGGNGRAGLYRLEYEVTFGDGTRETFPRSGYAYLDVVEDLG
jgi:hypothetical protein